MNRLTIIGLAAALAVGGSTMATAQSDRAIERSGKTFHVKVCKANINKDEARCHAHVVTDSVGDVITAASPFALPGGYGPGQLRAAYNLTGYTGSGATIAIVDAYGYANAEKDLATYRAQYGLPACTTANGCFKKLNQNGVQGSYPRDNTGWAQETALDLDMVSAICPGCKIVLVQADSNSFANLAAAENTAASQLGVVAISNSYGSSGDVGTSSLASAYRHPGIAITVSTGDSGYGVAFPATVESVVAVGGTSLKTASGARGYTETAWAGAGSGCSSTFAKPSWQLDAGCSKRTIADVSAVADPNTGVAVYGPTLGKKSGWMIFGGTSASAPIIAGVYGLAGPGAKSPQNLYAFPSFFDVVSGSNGSCGGSYLCTAGPGFDGPTGLGTPNGIASF